MMGCHPAKKMRRHLKAIRESFKQKGSNQGFYVWCVFFFYVSFWLDEHKICFEKVTTWEFHI